MAGVSRKPGSKTTKPPRVTVRGAVPLRMDRVKVKTQPSGRTKLAIQGKLVESSDAPAPRRTPAGTGGTTILSGKIRYEEFNPDLENDKGYGQPSRQGVYDQMRRTSGQIQRLLWLVKLPVLAAEAAVEPHPRAEFDQEEQSDLCYHNLFEVIPGARRLREALTMLDFGVSAFEATADVVEVPRSRFPGLKAERGGRPRAGERVPAVLFTDLELRPAKTFYEWKARPGKTSQVQALVQRDLRGNHLEVPGDWLLRFTHEQEGGNFQGVSMLRPVYKPYVLLDTLETVDAIRHERQNCGIPTLTLGEDASDDEIDKAEDILSSLASHEKGYLIIPAGWTFKWDVSGSGRGTDIAERIDQLKGDIADGAMGRFMSLGGGDTGSYALAETQADRHLDLITVTADYITSVINDGTDGWSPIRRIVDWNYGPQDYYPRFCLKNLRSKDDWVQVLPLLDKFITGSSVPKTYRLAQEILKRLRIPLAVLPTEEEFAELSKPKEPVAEVKGGGDPDEDAEADEVETEEVKEEVE